MAHPEIVLVSGQKLEIRGVVLFDQKGIAEVASLRAQAAQQLGGVSTGIGFLGSPAWAIGGAAVLGMIESAMSSSSRKQGLGLLKRAEQQLVEVRKAGLLFDVRQINGMDTPHPQAWWASHVASEAVDLTNVGWGGTRPILNKYGKTGSDIAKEQGRKLIYVEAEKRYVYDGEEFLKVDTEAGIMAVRWANVMAYLYE